MKDIKIFLFNNLMKVIGELYTETEETYIVHDVYTIDSIKLETGSGMSINPFKFLTDGKMIISKKDLMCLPVTPSDAFARYYQATTAYDEKNIADVDSYLDTAAAELESKHRTKQYLDNIQIYATEHLGIKHLFDLLTMTPPSESIH